MHSPLQRTCVCQLATTVDCITCLFLGGIYSWDFGLELERIIIKRVMRESRKEGGKLNTNVLKMD